METLHICLKTGSDLPRLIQKNNECPQEGVHHPLRPGVGSTVGLGGLCQAGSARQGAAQTIWKSPCNWRAPARPVQCSSAGAGPVISGITCDTESTQPNPATHTALGMLSGPGPSQWHHWVCRALAARLHCPACEMG